MDLMKKEKTPLIVTDKMLDCIEYGLRSKSWLMAFEGSIRSIKTTTVIQMLHFLVQQSDEIFHLIGAQDNNSIKDVILQAKLGLTTLYPEYYSLEKDEIGGYYVLAKCDVKNKPKIKKILLCGFGNKSRWKSINGHEFGVILLDEVNNANKQFVDECFARQTNVDCPKMLFTLNGDSPTHWIYQDYINHCKILGKAPASIIAEMSQVEKIEGYYYVHFTMYDNPTMTKEKIDRAESIFPKNSYYYKIKILGERGTTGKLIFNDYMSQEKHIKDLKDEIYTEYVVGVDIGSTRALNSFSLVGFKDNYTNVGVVDKYSFKQCGYDKKRELLVNTVLFWRNQGRIIKCISVDSAEQNFIYDLKTVFKQYGIDVISSYKATVKQRCDLMIVLLSLGKIVFNNTKEGRDSYQAYQMAKWLDGKENEEREDNNDPINDIMDSVEYALTRHMKKLLSYVKQEIKGEDYGAKKLHD